MGRSRDVETSIKMITGIGLAAISVIVADSIHRYTVFLAEKIRNYASDSVADTSFRLGLAEHTITNHIANTLARFFGTSTAAFEVATGSLFSVLSYFSIKNRESIDVILVPLTVLLTQRLTMLFEQAYVRYLRKLYLKGSRPRGVSRGVPRGNSTRAFSRVRKSKKVKH